jgi:hypothetical protein
VSNFAQTSPSERAYAAISIRILRGRAAQNAASIVIERRGKIVQTTGATSLLAACVLSLLTTKGRTQ